MSQAEQGSHPKIGALRGREWNRIVKYRGLFRQQFGMIDIANEQYFHGKVSAGSLSVDKLSKPWESCFIDDILMDDVSFVHCMILHR